MNGYIQRRYSFYYSAVNRTNSGFRFPRSGYLVAG